MGIKHSTHTLQTLSSSLNFVMKLFVVLFAAVVALSMGTPVLEIEERGELVDKVIVALKQLICNMEELEVRDLVSEEDMDQMNLQGFDFRGAIEKVVKLGKLFLCSE